MKRYNKFLGLLMAILVLAACEPRPRTSADFEAERQKLASEIQMGIDGLDGTIEALNARIIEDDMTRETKNTYREAVNDLREKKNDLQADLMRVQGAHQEDWVRIRRDVRRTLDRIEREADDIAADIDRGVERTF